MNKSYWQKTRHKQEYPSLQKDLNVDIVIIGGGLTGISLAYRLKKAMFDVVLLEQDEIGCGASGHSMAQITLLQDCIYTDLNDYYGYSYAKMYYESNAKAMEEIKEWIRDEKIDCDYEENEYILYTNDKMKIIKMKKEKQLLESFGIKVYENVYDQAIYSISIKKQVLFHPLKYLDALAKICQQYHIEIYEHSKVEKVKRIKDYYKVDVNQHVIQCDYVIHATQYPLLYHSFSFIKFLYRREFIQYGLLKNNDKRSLLCEDKPIKSYRKVDIGSLNIGNKVMKKSLKWNCQDYYSLRIIPYIGRFDLRYDEYIACGYHLWGMTLSNVASRLIADEILGIDNPYRLLYSKRHYSYPLIKKNIPLLYQHYKNAYFHQKSIETLKNLKKDDGMIIEKEGKKYAVYRDGEGKDHYFYPYCPHMKCLLSFQRETKTWECPCHGSSFDAYGKVIMGPSLSDLK